MSEQLLIPQQKRLPDDEIFDYTLARHKEGVSYTEISAELKNMGLERAMGRLLCQSSLSRLMVSRGHRTVLRGKHKNGTVLPQGIMTAAEVVEFTLDQKNNHGLTYLDIAEKLKSKGIQYLDRRKVDRKALCYFMRSRGHKIHKKTRAYKKRNSVASKPVEQKAVSFPRGVYGTFGKPLELKLSDRASELLSIYKNREFSLEERESMAKILLQSK